MLDYELFYKLPYLRLIGRNGVPAEKRILAYSEVHITLFSPNADTLSSSNSISYYIRRSGKAEVCGIASLPTGNLVLKINKFIHLVELAHK